MLDEQEVRKQEPFFGKWRLDRKIGSGSFGDVYQIYHIQNGVTLYAAMKVITIPQSRSDIDELRTQGLSEQEIRSFYEKQVDAFINEIKILHHFRGNDHIVCFEDYKVVKHERRNQWDIYIRMECLEQLDTYLKRIRATRQDVLKLWFEIGLALISCHGSNIVHRDIKAANILVSREGYYKLVDFGIARHIGKNLISTAAGTYPYMAPEVQRHEPYSGQADIYSLGIVIYQLLNANRYPFLPPAPQLFSVDQRDAAIEQRLSGKTVPPIPGLPPAIMKILWKSLAFEPSHRYATAEALVRDLQNLTLTPEEASVPLFDRRGDFLPVIQRAKQKKPAWFIPLILAVSAVLYIFIKILLKS